MFILRKEIKLQMLLPFVLTEDFKVYGSEKNVPIIVQSSKADLKKLKYRQTTSKSVAGRAV